MTSRYPVWIQYSGLPRVLSDETRGTAAWLLFKTIVEIDCRRSAPATVDVPVVDLANLTGIDAEQILDILPVYRELKLAKMFLPEDTDENLVIEIAKVLPAPETHTQVREKMIADPAIDNHRYCDCPEAKEMDPHDPALRQIIDLYLAQIKPTMNSITVDRLNTLRHKASLDDIRFAFRSAEKNNIRSLVYVERVALKIKDRSIKNR